jgi:hypothetical protein
MVETVAGDGTFQDVPDDLATRAHPGRTTNQYATSVPGLRVRLHEQ